MSDFDHKWQRDVKQKRADDAIKAIGEAAVVLSQEGRLDLLTTRTVSEFSGYSVGTIYRYFERFEDIFINLFLKRRLDTISELVVMIDRHPPAARIDVLLSAIVEKMIHELARPHPKVLKWILRQFFKHANEPEKINVIIDILVLPLIAAAQRDESGSFRLLAEDELRLILRASQAMVRSPFFEQDPIAGSKMHIEFVTNETIRLLSNMSNDSDKK